MHGFRDVILASIELGKGIILPTFQKHRTDKLSKHSRIPSGLRIDVSKLCELVSIKPESSEKVQNHQNETYGTNLSNSTKKVISGAVDAVVYLNQDNLSIERLKKEKKYTSYYKQMIRLGYVVDNRTKEFTVWERVRWGEKGRKGKQC